MKSTITNKDNNYSLYNSENYKKELDSNINDITKKYADLIIEYYKFIQENIKVYSMNISGLAKGTYTVVCKGINLSSTTRLIKN